MAQILASLPLVGQLLGGSSSPTVQLDAVEVHPVEIDPEKRSRTIKHLLRANHANHALVYHNLQRHNHLPHALCAAYLLGAGRDQLHHIYDVINSKLEPWVSSPAEITTIDWRDFLGDARYQRAFVDFFEDILAEHSVSYNWKKVIDRYLLAGPKPLVNNLISGLGHPLIHLAYAYEFDSPFLAIEGLATTAISYNYLHQFIDDARYTRPPPPKLAVDGASLTALLGRVAADDRFDGLLSATADQADTASDRFDKTMAALFETPATTDALLEYWNAWSAAENPTERFRDAQETATALLIATVAPGTHSYSFFLSHVLTASHAVRVLLPQLPPRFHLSLLRQWWLLTLAVYVSVRRPHIAPDNVPTDRKGHGWAYVEEQALTSRWCADAQYITVLRSIKEATRTWGDIRDHYLNAAVHFIDDFEGWVH